MGTGRERWLWNKISGGGQQCISIIARVHPDHLMNADFNVCSDIWDAYTLESSLFCGSQCSVMFSRGQNCSFYSVWQWNDVDQRSLNSDNACRYSSHTCWCVMLWLSEHRRELACESCLRRRPSTVEYGTLFHCRHNAADGSVDIGHEIMHW